MSDYFRKPAIGTKARELHDAKLIRKICACGSRHLKSPTTNTCIACDPTTKDRYRAMLSKQKGSKQ